MLLTPQRSIVLKTESNAELAAYPQAVEGYLLPAVDIQSLYVRYLRVERPRRNPKINMPEDPNRPMGRPVDQEYNMP